MNTQSLDTPKHIEDLLIAGYRRMKPWEKLRKIGGLNRFARRLAMAGVRRRYPGASERELQMRMVSRWLPADIMRRLLRWNPDKEGY